MDLNYSVLYSTAVLFGSIFVGGIMILQILIRLTDNKSCAVSILSIVYLWIEYFEEFILSVFSIFLSAFIYYYLDFKFSNQKWFDQYSSIVQLVLIIASIIVMNLLSVKFQHGISKNDKTGLRLLGSIYSITNLVVIEIITGDKSQYTTIVCYVGLMFGRFIFFDTSISSIISDFKRIGKKVVLFPTMVIIVICMFLIYTKQ